MTRANRLYWHEFRLAVAECLREDVDMSEEEIIARATKVADKAREEFVEDERVLREEVCDGDI